MRNNNRICFILFSFSLAFFYANPTFAQTTTYTYDTLGRLTFVQDVNGNRDYDYDNAGNRTEVAIATTSDDVPVTPVLPAPVLSAGACSQIAPGAYRGQWNAVAGAGAYKYRTQAGNEYIVTSLNSIQNSPCQWVRACTTTADATCTGTKANF